MRSMIGKWAVCHRGRIGYIEQRVRQRGRYVYKGVGLDNLPWQSVKPLLLNEWDAKRVAGEADWIEL